MTKEQNKVWGGFAVASFLAATLIYIFVALLLEGAAFLAAAIFFFALWGVTLVRGFYETPTMYTDIIECLGVYVGEPYNPGPHILFPYFNFEKIKARVYLGDQKLGLYLDENTESGDVEFEDSSASLWAYFFFRITDPEKANYQVDDVIGSVKEKAEHVLRSFFGVYKLDEAITLKGFFKLENVVTLLDKSDDSPERVKLSPEEFKNLKANPDEVKNSSFFLTLEEWGVLPKAFIVSDIEIPEEIKKERARILTAEKNKEVAEIDKQTSLTLTEIQIIKAKADAESASISGQGEAERLKKITESGIEPQGAIEYLVAKEKWGAVKSNPNVTLIIGEKAIEGAQIGAGIGAVTNKKD